MPPNNQPSSFQPYTPTPPTSNPNFSNPPQSPIESKTNSSSGILVGVIVILLVIIAGLAFFYFTRTPSLTTQTQAGTALPFGQAPGATPIAGTTTSNSSCQDNDWSCLLTAAQTCSPATLLVSSIGIVNRYEITGMNNNICSFKESFLGGTVKLTQALIDKSISQGAKQSEIDGFIKFLQTGTDYSKGKVLSCQSSASELSAFLQDQAASTKQLEETGSSSLDSNSPSSTFTTNKCKMI